MLAHTVDLLIHQAQKGGDVFKGPRVNPIYI